MVPLHLLVTFLVGWLQHEQHEVIQYLREENRVLKAHLRNQRDERRRLAALGAPLGRRRWALYGYPWRTPERIRDALLAN